MNQIVCILIILKQNVSHLQTEKVFNSVERWDSYESIFSISISSQAMDGWGAGDSGEVSSQRKQHKHEKREKDFHFNISQTFREKDLNIRLLS